MISIIAAVARNGVIGDSHGRFGLPWHLPADLKRFKELTTGKPLIMGRTTWQLIGKPLPNRHCIMLSQHAAQMPGIETFSSLNEALEAYKDEEEIMIGGGAQVWRTALPLADWLFLTEVDLDAEGDTLFPPYNRKAYKEAKRERHDGAGDAPAFSWIDYIHQPEMA